MMCKCKSYFYYFAYGSNLLKRRILLNNPSAVFVGVGRLDVSGRYLFKENYKLEFVHYNDLWGGAVATIVKSEDEHVWGAVWKMKNENLISLDKQEGVDEQQYFPKKVVISSVNGKKNKCRTYLHYFVPPYLKSLSSLPEDRRPSITYKQCIVSGAVECHMPEDYVSMLRTIPDNGRHATDTLRIRLKL